MMALDYYAILTTVGLQRLAEAQASGVPLVLSHFAVGDGAGAAIVPDVAMTALVNERWRGLVNSVDVYPDAVNTVRVEGQVPAESGGWTIREAGVFSPAGELISIASYPPTYKTKPEDGASVEEYIRILIEYAAVEAVALSVDPAVVIATRLYVDERTAGGRDLWRYFV